MPKIVRKSNALISASYRLTAAEQRVIFCAISKIKPMQKISDKALYAVSTNDLSNCGINIKHCSDILNSASEQLFSRSATITASDGQEIKTRWIQSLRSQNETESNYIELRFSRDIAPYLNDLTKNFTQFSLREAVSLSSAHAGRIFELLMQYQSVGSRMISLIDLREMLGLENKYPAFSDFRKRCLDTSIKEINNKTNLQIRYELIRTGRSISDIKFTFHHPTKRSSSPSNAEAISTGQSVTALSIPALSDSQRGKYAVELSKDIPFQRYAKTGESEKDFYQRIKRELRSEEFVIKYLPDLEAMGFKR